MKKNGGGNPDGLALDLINKSFGDFEKFKAKFVEVGLSQFGSGWVWLVLNKNILEIRKTANAETPLTAEGIKLLATADVWEHAYYIDTRNNRKGYLEIFLSNLINWDFINENITK